MENTIGIIYFVGFFITLITFRLIYLRDKDVSTNSGNDKDVLFFYFYNQTIEHDISGRIMLSLLLSLFWIVLIIYLLFRHSTEFFYSKFIKST